jgi:hypothetical protein
MQSVSTVQLVLQAVAPQAYGVQAVVLGAGQEPAPLQLAAAVAVPLLQLALRQELVEYAQAVARTPLQLPPQELPSVAQATRAPCGAPLTVVQVPTLPATSQAWH